MSFIETLQAVSNHIIHPMFAGFAKHAIKCRKDSTQSDCLLDCSESLRSGPEVTYAIDQSETGAGLRPLSEGLRWSHPGSPIEHSHDRPLRQTPDEGGWQWKMRGSCEVHRKVLPGELVRLFLRPAKDWRCPILGKATGAAQNDGR